MNLGRTINFSSLIIHKIRESTVNATPDIFVMKKVTRKFNRKKETGEERALVLRKS